MEEGFAYPKTGSRHIRYRRDLQHSYMIVESRFDDTGFEKQMLQENRLASLLPFSAVSIEDRTQFWYDITGRRSLRDLIRSEGVSAKTLVWLFGCVLRAQEELSLCMILPGHVPIDPDLVFTDGSGASGDLLFCYCPDGESVADARFLPLMDLIITYADEKEQDLYDFCYELHAAAASQEPSAAELLARTEERFPEATRALSDDDAPGRRLLMLTSDTWLAENDGRTEADPIKVRPSVKERQPKSAPPAGDILPSAGDAPAEDAFLQKWKKRFRKWGDGLRKDLQKEPAAEDLLVPAAPGTADAATTFLAEKPSVCRGFLCYEGTHDEPDFVITREEFCIGSSLQGNDAVLASRTVSRHHARILHRNGRYYLEDLNSRNGTRVNGQLLEYHQSIALCAGDRIQFAGERYRME